MKKRILAIVLTGVFLGSLLISCTLFYPNLLVGTWVINDTVLHSWDEPGTTNNRTINQTMTFNADLTFTMEGTGNWEGEATHTMEGDGTYSFDEEAGTLDMVFVLLLLDGIPMAVVVPTLQYEITGAGLFSRGDTLTLTYPAGLAYTPLEPVVFTRE